MKHLRSIGRFAILLAMILIPTLTAHGADRRIAVDPPGFTRVSVNGREVTCLPEDQAWVRRTLQEYKSPEMPSTMPSELVERITSQRSALTKTIVTDLALPNDKFVDPLFDTQLIPPLQRLQALHPPFIYLVATRDQLKAAMKAGWTDPRYTYAKASEEISYNDSVQLSTDKVMDDALLWVVCEPGDAADAKAKKLTDMLTSDEKMVTDMTWGRGNEIVQTAFANFIGEQIVVPLQLADDQKWLGFGFAGALSAKYTAAVTGIDRGEVIMRTVVDNPNNLLRPAQIDLLHPIAPGNVQPEYRGVYDDAFRRKSIGVTHRLLQSAGDDCVPKLLAALRKKLPPDGDALVKVIKDVTGQDVTNNLKAK